MIFIILTFILLILFPTLRCFLSNILRVVFYAIRDIFNYFRLKKWREWDGYGLKIYVGLFGRGKTLSAVKEVVRQYKRYNLNILSNIKLYGVPYTPLTNYKQIIDAPSNTLILIDEISTLFNSRTWKDFNIDLLFQLLQCRKQKKMIIATAQRFSHVDKLVRDITRDVVVCDKLYRFMRTTTYDAWNYENCMNTDFLKPLSRGCVFISNDDYNSYDTSELIDNFKKETFVSNSTILVNRGTVEFNDMLVSKKSLKRKFLKKRDNR